MMATVLTAAAGAALGAGAGCEAGEAAPLGLEEFCP